MRRHEQLVALLFVLGCTGTLVEQNPPQQREALCDSARSLRSSPQFLSVAEEADIAARVLAGGFGGLYTDFSASTYGPLVAYFRDPEPLNQRKADLRALLRCGAVYPGWADTMIRTELDAITIRQGQFTATEILAYLRALEPVSSDPAVWAMEIDPEINRVWIGVLEQSHLARIQQAAIARGVPITAVSIETPPPVTGFEQFDVLNGSVVTMGGEAGILGFSLQVRFTNHQSSTRYPQWCVDIDPDHFTKYFLYVLEKWDGSTWRTVKTTLCVSVLLPPRSVAPLESVTDSVPIVGVRRLNMGPSWMTARISGTYRFVGQVYRSTTGGDPSTEPVWLTDPAPPEESVSGPFRVVNRLPF